MKVKVFTSVNDIPCKTSGACITHPYNSVKQTLQLRRVATGLLFARRGGESHLWVGVERLLGVNIKHSAVSLAHQRHDADFAPADSFAFLDER